MLLDSIQTLLSPLTSRELVQVQNPGDDAATHHTAEQGDPEAHSVVPEEVNRLSRVQLSCFLRHYYIR